MDAMTTTQPNAALLRLLSIALMAALPAAALEGGQLDSGHPAVVLIMSQRAGANHVCTGTLIAPDVVLTAAHCANRLAATRATPQGIYTGSGIDRATGRPVDARSQTPAVADFAQNPGWHPSTAEHACPSSFAAGDVALVKLAQPVTGITPLQRGTPPRSGNCSVVGFGQHHEGGTESATRKRTGLVTITSSSRWITALSRPSGPPEGNIVHGAQAALPAEGDSGGPLICNGRVVGVVSCQSSLSSHSAYFGVPNAVNTWVTQTLARWRHPASARKAPAKKASTKKASTKKASTKKASTKKASTKKAPPK